jgi:trans-2,3-dihydro-3-hydroxyanthranilate isomerase
MQFAGHPIIGTSWVLMNKILIIITSKKYCNGSYWPNSSLPIRRFSMVESSSTTILIFFKDDFLSLTNLERNDYDSRFDIQEVTTGSAL